MQLRVLELGDNLAAAYAGRLFAREGAEVIRVEPLGSTAEVRNRASPLYPSPDGTVWGDSYRQSLQTFLHPGKHRIGLDWQTEEGGQVLMRLAGAVDIVLSDLAPAELDAIGWSQLGGERTKARTSITPFGLTGPYRDWQGNGAVLLAMGGYTFLIGDPGRAPLTLPGHYAEYQAGQFAYLTTLATLLTGDDGPTPVEPVRAIDVSILETVLSLTQFTTVYWTYRGEIRGRHGNRFENVHPVCLFPCQDGWVGVNVVMHFWEPFTEMIGRPDLKSDPRFENNNARMQHVEALNEIVQAALADKTMAEVLDLGQRQFRVPTGAMLDLSQTMSDEHLAAREFWQQTTLPEGATLTTPGPSWRYRGTDDRITEHVLEPFDSAAVEPQDRELAHLISAKSTEEGSR